MIATTEIRRPALRYYGGKWKLAPWIISHFPDHKNYVEPCGGAASVLLQKPRSPLETYNDLDGNVVNFFQVLRDRPDELIHKIRLTPWARAEYELCREPDLDPIENARRFFACGWMSISGMAFEMSTGWRATTFDGQSFTPHLYQYQYTQDILQKISDRLLSVQIENKNASYVIERYDNKDTVIYFDPPYMAETRSQSNQYLIETDDTFHTEAAALLRSALGYVVVSGYACPLYTELYEAHDWSRFDKEAQTNSGGKRIESLWLSPRTVEALQKPRQVPMFSSSPAGGLTPRPK